MNDADLYRIRWANVRMAFGHHVRTKRMCIAERRHRFLGISFIPFWCPVTDGWWRETEDEAKLDIARDHELRQPLPKATTIAYI